MKKYKWGTHRIVQETKETISIYFDTKGVAFNFLPGQFINVSCVIEGQTVIRSYSLSSATTAVHPVITVKRVKEGIMSNYLLDHAHTVTSWEIQGPFGNFVLNEQTATSSSVVLLGGGSGISALFSMLHSTVGKKVIPLLLYSNRTIEDTIFYDAIEKLREQKKIEVHYCFTTEEVGVEYLRDDFYLGRFSVETIKQVIRGREDYREAHYYLCGPTGLMYLYQKALEGMDIGKEQIHSEYFELEEQHTENELNTSARDIFIHYYEDTLRNEEVETYECMSMIEVKANQTLLEAIRDHHISVPSSCKNGTCGACWAVRTDGKVMMKSNHVLSEANLTEGIILLCQSYPMDEDVTVSLLGEVVNQDR